MTALWRGTRTIRQAEMQDMTAWRDIDMDIDDSLAADVRVRYLFTLTVPDDQKILIKVPRVVQIPKMV